MFFGLQECHFNITRHLFCKYVLEASHFAVVNLISSFSLMPLVCSTACFRSNRQMKKRGVSLEQADNFWSCIKVRQILLFGFTLSESVVAAQASEVTTKVLNFEWFFLSIIVPF